MNNLEPMQWKELPDMMSVRQLRRYLQIGDKQARRWAKDNELYIKIGGNVRIPKSELKQTLVTEWGVHPDRSEYNEKRSGSNSKTGKENRGP